LSPGASQAQAGLAGWALEVERYDWVDHVALPGLLHLCGQRPAGSHEIHG